MTLPMSGKMMSNNIYISPIVKVLELEALTELERAKFEYTAAFYYNTHRTPAAQANLKASIHARYDQIQKELKNFMKKITEEMNEQL